MKIPNDTFFIMPFITSEQDMNYINKLEPSKTTGPDGLGPGVLKIAASIISPSITVIIIKSI